MSTCGLPVSRRASIRSGRRCSVCGPNTRSTYGARSTIAAPSCEATQPPTPISTSGFACLNSFQRPSCENTFSCAFSRIEQVFTRITSASATSCVRTMPRSAASTSSILRESYSFIWQPWVWMNNFFDPGLAGAGVSGIGNAERAETRIVASPAAAGRRSQPRSVNAAAWQAPPAGAHCRPMNAVSRPGARGGWRRGPRLTSNSRWRMAIACALFLAAAWAGPAVASVLYRCVGAGGEMAYVSSTAGYKGCVKLGQWHTASVHRVEASQHTTHKDKQPSGTTLPGQPPRSVKANPAVLKITPLGEDDAVPATAQVDKQAWQPFPVVALDTLGSWVLPRVLGVELAPTRPAPAPPASTPAPSATAPIPLKLEADKPTPPRRGAVYRVVQKNGTVLYTNVASLAQGHDAKMLFTYIVE